MIAHNRDRKPKKLWTERAGASRSTIAELGDEHEEARCVAGEIDRLTTEEGIGRDEVAVFYRTNAQSRVLEDTLVRFDVPYQVIGGTKFYERAEIKDAIAYLSLLANPADAVAFAPDRQLSAARHRPAHPGSGCSPTRTRPAPAVWEVAERAERGPGLGAGGA